MSGRKIELDEVVEPLFQPESSTVQKVVSVEPTLVEEEVNDDDHEASDQVTIKPRRSTRTRTTPEWYGNPVLTYELWRSDDGPGFQEMVKAMKSEMGSM